MRHSIPRLATAAVLVLAVPGLAHAYDEAVSGDLSTIPETPTPLAFVAGTNVLKGRVTTSGTPSDTRDCITFTIPAGLALVSLRQISWVDQNGLGANTGYHSLNNGATSQIPTGANANQFLGGEHVFPGGTGTDVLPGMADGFAGLTPSGTGFSLPLGPGTYSYIIQQTSSHIGNYEMHFLLAAPRRVPATSLGSATALALLLTATGAVLARRARRRR